MNRIIQITFLALTLVLVSGCKVETRPDNHVLRVSFSPAHFDDWGWAAATAMVFDFNDTYYSQTEVVDYHYYHYGYDDVSINDISLLLWEIGGIDSYITGTLSFREIRTHINSGNPILLHYGDYYNGQYMLLHGYDDNGYIYLHDPDYGTRIIHYEDLFLQEFYGLGNYWSSSLIILD